MTSVESVTKAGIRKGKVFLRFASKDKKLHEVLLPPAVAVQAAVSIFAEVCKLPEADALTHAQWAAVFEAMFRYLGA